MSPSNGTLPCSPTALLHSSFLSTANKNGSAIFSRGRPGKRQLSQDGKNWGAWQVADAVLYFSQQIYYTHIVAMMPLQTVLNLELQLGPEFPLLRQDS